MTGSGNAVVEALPGIVGGLLSGTIAGLLAARAEVGYQQRAAAITEIRRLALDAAGLFHSQAITMGYATSETSVQRFYEEGFYEIMSAVRALSRSYGVHSVWLGASTRATVEKIIRGLSDHSAQMFETIDKDRHVRQEVGKDAVRGTTMNSTSS
jgi:hypothetical protein